MTETTVRQAELLDALKGSLARLLKAKDRQVRKVRELEDLLTAFKFKLDIMLRAYRSIQEGHIPTRKRSILHPLTSIGACISSLENEERRIRRALKALDETDEANKEQYKALQSQLATLLTPMERSIIDDIQQLEAKLRNEMELNHPLPDAHRLFCEDLQATMELLEESTTVSEELLKLFKAMIQKLQGFVEQESFNSDLTHKEQMELEDSYFSFFSGMEAYLRVGGPYRLQSCERPVLNETLGDMIAIFALVSEELVRLS